MKFLVTTDHVSPTYAVTDHEFTVSEYGSSGLWYAKATKFGCSKNYETPEGAIRAMCSDHACTNVRIIKA